MSPSLPVPSKAAIHALRGLALGTSCAIGFIVEDRRRRINTLRTAINNMKRLRESRQYHGSAESVAYAADNVSFLPAQNMHWTYAGSVHDQPSRARKRRDRRSDAKAYIGNVQKDTNVGNSVDSLSHLSRTNEPPKSAQEKADQPLSYIRPHPRRPIVNGNGSWSRQSLSRRLVQPGNRVAALSRLTPTEIASALKPKSAFRGYMTAFLSETPIRTEAGELDQGWLAVSTALCSQCHAEGQWDEAQKVLATVVRAGSLDEAQFYAHDPLGLINTLLSNEAQSDDADTGGLESATELFLTKFNSKPRLHQTEICEVGKALILRLLTRNRPQLVHPIYRRVLVQSENPESLTAWFMQQMHDYSDYKSVIKCYRLNFSKMSPTSSCFNEVVDLVLESVESMRGAYVDQVSLALAKQCAAKGLMTHHKWLMRLLEAHWGRSKDLASLRTLFDQLHEMGFLEQVENPEFVYQLMVKFSILADDDSAAQHYHKMALATSARMSTDIWLNGYLVLGSARRGDWDGVAEGFRRMKPYRAAQETAYDQTFVAVLKVFIESHPIAEVEKFIRHYITKMDVGLHRSMVTLVANKYGQLHDTRGFMDWLRYCSSLGFTFDPAFCNSVLRNCRVKWNFPFHQLRLLFSKMRRLNPSCVDPVTERIVHNAALEDGTYSGKNARHRVGSLKVSMSRLPNLSKSANEREVLHTMSQQLAQGYPARAVKIYKQALRFGMPWCPSCFRIAVSAALKMEHGNLDTGLRLINEAYKGGHDVTPAVALYIKTQLDHFRGPYHEVLLLLKGLISRFESIGVLIDPSVLTHAAIISAQFKRFHHAIGLCQAAMDKKGTKDPCFSRQSLRALLMSYWQQLDVPGLRKIVRSLPKSPLSTDTWALDLLKSTRRHVKRLESSEVVTEFDEVLQQGITEMKQRRATQIQERDTLVNETLRIMGDAARDFERGNTNGVSTGGDDAQAENLGQKKSVPNLHSQLPVAAYG